MTTVKQGRVSAQTGVRIKLAWDADSDLPAQFDFAVLSGEMEAGPVTVDTVVTNWLGEVSTIDEAAYEVTIITPYNVKEQLPAGAQIVAGSLGYCVLSGSQVIPFDSQVHSERDIVGLVLSTAAAEGDLVWVLRK